MPDFDPKTIPTLDDVIETVETEDVENTKIENDNTESDAIENEPALFAAEPVIDFSINIDDESIQPESDINELIESSSTDSDFAAEADSVESALIDYSAEHESDAPTDDETIDPDEITLEIDEPAEPPTEPQPLFTTDELQTITDGVINQLMPELEQHLRDLIQQALKEKLPLEVISPHPASNKNIDD